MNGNMTEQEPSKREGSVLQQPKYDGRGRRHLRNHINLEHVEVWRLIQTLDSYLEKIRSTSSV